MTGDNHPDLPGSSNTARAETVALAGFFLHLVAATGLLIAGFFGGADAYTYTSDSGGQVQAASFAGGIFSYKLLGLQAAAGLAFFLACYLQLRFRRRAASERQDRAELERQRRLQGLGSLFAEDEVGASERNLLQFEKYIAPFFGLVAVGLLLLPSAFALLQMKSAGVGPGAYFFGSLPRALSLAYGFIPLIAAFVLFITGIYASGLCRARQWRPLRAGAGYILSTAAFLALTGAALLLSGKTGFIPERIIALLVCICTALQAAEILLNLILDLYRPRQAGQEARPAYDSRLTGLLAEPQSIYRTFAHTLDYQFGFRVSETWFFRFVEKAFAPLLLILLLSFYLLSCFVIVRPGQAAIIERFGAPRGFTPGAEKDWESFAKAHPPTGEGLCLKWPWPIEKARIVDRSRRSQITLGFGSGSEDESRRKADELRGKMAEWDKEHVSDETLYLMPLPTEMRTAGVAASADPRNAKANYVFISGAFTVEYQIDSAADVYRFAYNYRDPQAMVRAVSEKEITRFLAGANFWDVMARQTDAVRTELFKRISDAATQRGLGIRVVNVGIHNMHPPAGEVGKAFLDVIASRQKKQVEIYKGEVEKIQIIGTAPSQAQALVMEAEVYKYRRQVVAQAEAKWFEGQLKAYAAAPGSFLNLRQMQALESGLAGARKVLLPEGTTMIMDDSKAADPDSINNILAREINKLNSK